MKIPKLLVSSILLVPSIALAYNTNKTSGPCSPIASNNTGVVTIRCSGISDKVGKQLIEIVNQIQERQLDPNTVLHKLDEIQKGIDEIRDRSSARRLSQRQKSELTLGLSAYRGQKVDVLSILGDPEGMQYAQDFVDVFQRSGWIVKAGGVTQGIFGTPGPKGIEVTVKDPSSAPAVILPLAQALRRAAIEVGLFHNEQENIEPGSFQFRVGTKNATPR